MAKKHADEGGEWPAGSTEGNGKPEQESGELRKPEPPPYESDRPKTIAVPTEKGVIEISTEPTDLGDYEGEYKLLATGEIFGLKMVENDPHYHPYHLKSIDHYWEGTAEEFRKAFEKQ